MANPASRIHQMSDRELLEGIMEYVSAINLQLAAVTKAIDDRLIFELNQFHMHNE